MPRRSFVLSLALCALLAESRADALALDAASIAQLIEGAGAPRLLIGGPADDSRPRWSPDGSRLAFLSNRAEAPDLHPRHARR